MEAFSRASAWGSFYPCWLNWLNDIQESVVDKSEYRIEFLVVFKVSLDYPVLVRRHHKGQILEEAGYWSPCAQFFQLERTMPKTKGKKGGASMVLSERQSRCVQYCTINILNLIKLLAPPFVQPIMWTSKNVAAPDLARCSRSTGSRLGGSMRRRSSCTAFVSSDVCRGNGPEVESVCFWHLVCLCH